MGSKYLIILLMIFFSSVLYGQKSLWKSLETDGLHDPESPAIGVLQEPSSALLLLPSDAVGNRVSWVRALRDKHIEPRTNIFPETKVNVLDMDIVLENTGEMALVLFPHKPHTEWLDCKNCHDGLFKEKVGANPINMSAILSGEYCGRCHGAVAFPLTECNRCHSLPRNLFKGKPGVQKKSVTHKKP